jgi:hypothetical protein
VKFGPKFIEERAARQRAIAQNQEGGAAEVIGITDYFPNVELSSGSIAALAVQVFARGADYRGYISASIAIKNPLGG